MNHRLLVSGSLRVLTRYKARSFFMSLGIVIGVAALVVMRSVGAGAEQDMMENVNRMLGASSIMIVNSGGAMHGGRIKPEKLSIEDLEVIADRLEQVTDWDPTLATAGREMRYKGRSHSARVIGHSERAEVVWGRGVSEGEFISRSDVRSAARVALIGSKTADALFDGEDPVGKEILIENVPFRVKGVLADHGIDPHGMDMDDEAHVPITTVMRRMLDLDTIGSAKLIVASPDEVEETVEEVAEILRERHGLEGDQRDDFSLFTPTQVQRTVKRVNRVMSVYVPATAGIALMVAGIVIANIMLMGVAERVPEIGLRKALGATSRQIGGQVLLESLTLATLAGLLGIGVGAAIILGMSHTASAATRIAPDSIGLGLGAALVVGSLAGFLPARRASLQEAVDALR